MGARAYPRLYLYEFLASAERISCDWVVFGCDVSHHATVHPWSRTPLSETSSDFCNRQVKVPEIFSALLVVFPIPHPCKLAEAAPGPKAHELTALHCACCCSHAITHLQGLEVSAPPVTRNLCCAGINSVSFFASNWLNCLCPSLAAHPHPAIFPFVMPGAKIA